MSWVKKLGIVIAIAVVLAAITTGGIALEVKKFLAAKPSAEHREVIVAIPRGAGPNTVATLLHKEGVVTDAKKFAWFLRARDAARGLRALELRFFTDLTPWQVLDVLLTGPEVTWPVTLPEGLRIEEMALLAEQAGFGTAAQYKALARDPNFVAALRLPDGMAPKNLEGLLLPDTYSFRRGATARDVIEAQVRAMTALWDARRLARAAERKMSPYEVVTLASIVEKETGRADERPHIAAVFHNRLRLGMRLESDPTIIYGLEGYDGNIRRDDIRRPHPWNTYVIPALPPTPIAAPGKAAIDAVLWPIESADLFFVATGAGGAHDFSATYPEHAAKVRRYQGE